MRGRPALSVRAPLAREPERRYLLDVVLRDWLGLDYDLRLEERPDVVLRAPDETGPVLSLPDVLLSTDPAVWLTEASLPRPGHRTVSVHPIETTDGDAGANFKGLRNRGGLPILYAHDGIGDHAVRQVPNGLALDVDIFGTVFFMLTRYEEIVSTMRDVHGRFPIEGSVADREGLTRRPIVDEYVDLLWAAIHSLWPWLERRKTTFELCLTHDIDVPWATWRRSPTRVVAAAVRDVVTQRRAGLAARRLRAAVDARSGRVDRDPYDTFDTLMDASERHNLASSFYFLAGNVPGDVDFRYSISDAPVADLMNRITARGHEVGLHASYASFDSAERMTMEAEALRSAASSAGATQDTWGVRQHYLRFAAPYTWRHHEAAGIDYDSTIGFAEAPGFRAGTCHEFQVFDVLARRTMRLHERPLHVMDVSLFEYMDMDKTHAHEEIVRVVSACRRHAGRAVLLFHNNSLPTFRLGDWYADLINELARDLTP